MSFNNLRQISQHTFVDLEVKLFIIKKNIFVEKRRDKIFIQTRKGE